MGLGEGEEGRARKREREREREKERLGELISFCLFCSFYFIHRIQRDRERERECVCVYFGRMRNN